MKGIGLDIGSRTIKKVVCENGRITETQKEINTHDPLGVCREMLGKVNGDCIIATGYGRHLLGRYYRCGTVSEIKAFARGAFTLCDSCRTVLDIGGQDTKAISLDSKGRILKFHMNDKCAAGTGRFLEIMAMALGLSMDDFILEAVSADVAENINSMCAVFAESEVISMIARGSSRAGIAMGIHKAAANRALALLEKVSIKGDILFAGGVALNQCMRKLLEGALGRHIIIPGDPQLVGALGCALIASESKLEGD